MSSASLLVDIFIMNSLLFIGQMHRFMYYIFMLTRILLSSGYQTLLLKMKF